MSCRAVQFEPPRPFPTLLPPCALQPCTVLRIPRGIGRHFSLPIRIQPCAVLRVPRGIDRHSSLPIRIQPWAILRISSQSCPKSIPTAAASWGSREVGVIPGRVLASRQ